VAVEAAEVSGIPRLGWGVCPARSRGFRGGAVDLGSLSGWTRGSFVSVSNRGSFVSVSMAFSRKFISAGTSGGGREVGLGTE